MPLQRITLTLARSREYPNGSAAHGYEMVAPLDGSGHLDAREWAKAKEACTIRRFWADEEIDLGHLVHRGGPKGGSWAFTYDIAGDEDDEAGFRFGAHSFNMGDYVSIRDEDGVMHTFTVSLIEPA
ncbi:MAG: hypothetical protein ING72_03300 [Methylobacterium sp.]|jgi:hypothetical protein|nr:hypothetical protein [Burkholderiales bacterium]MCA3594305.1 hypothetical protein [Methylobacterium sp.]MCA3604509.1 hypothetical protein [Methylobacterium sp.]MCA3613485.1 hypothetical protein [Methylobacterium sp.]MCA3613956.1 hypothetical protein [Methylobacterium sp.]